MFRAVYPPSDPRMLYLHTKITKQQRKYSSYLQLLDSAGIYFHLQLSPLARLALITSKITKRADYPDLPDFLFFNF